MYVARPYGALWCCEPFMVCHECDPMAQWCTGCVNMVPLPDGDNEDKSLIVTHLATAPWWRRHHGTRATGVARAVDYYGW